MEPTLRKPLGILAILALILIWAVLIASFSGIVGGWPVLAQALFYAVAGTVWVLPMGPMLRWMETGDWRRRQ